jgi:ribosomal protein S18 acetylase RimI-like enzyme
MLCNTIHKSSAEHCDLLLPTGREAIAATIGGEVRACRRADLPRLVEIHHSQLCPPGTLLGRLSPQLLAEFYANFLKRSVFLVHAFNGEVDGFVLGGAPALLSRCRLALLGDHGLRCALEIARRPSLWLRTPRTLCKLVGSKMSSPRGTATGDEFLLLSIAVDPSATGRGVGTALVRGFEDAARKQSQAYRLDVLKTNLAALRFYDKFGFEYVGETARTWTLRKILSPSALAADLRAA